MAQPGSPPPPPGSTRPPSGRDWTTEAADRIESVVTSVRDKTTVPVRKIAAAVVYGLVAGLLGAVAFILLLVGVFRLHAYLPFHPEGRRVWVSYAALGAIFVGAGGFLWRKRTAQPKG
ncbi:MAG TPA: hypothetical protein VHT75_02295 [Acidimicrobiales bacterium]|jgi:hypothetical protein|nr:hypothetical protein [Acidimicrobiales bacterium]